MVIILFIINWDKIVYLFYVVIFFYLFVIYGYFVWKKCWKNWFYYYIRGMLGFYIGVVIVFLVNVGIYIFIINLFLLIWFWFLLILIGIFFVVSVLKKYKKCSWN